MAGGDGNRTDELVKEAALQLFAAKGFDGTGIRDIATKAGVTTASLYHYIGTKEDLLIRIIREGMEVLIAGGVQALEEADGGAAEQLAALVRSHVRYHARNPLLAQVIDTQFTALSGHRRAEALALRDDYEKLWAAVVARGAASAEFQLGDQALTRFALLAMCNGVVSWYSPRGRLSVDEIARHFVAMAHGLVGYPSRLGEGGFSEKG
jgi:AcrR family transcriptional regulator